MTKDVAVQTGTDKGRPVHRDAGKGQARVGESAPGPDQTAPLSSSRGPAVGGGDDGTAPAESDRTAAGGNRPPQDDSAQP